jgi:cathepsin H
MTGIPTQAHVDYRKYCQKIKNQGECGSCWSFGITGTMECQLGKEKGQSMSLSEQELIDCVSGNGGCCGGTEIYGFAYAWEKGVLDEKDYGPYTATKGTCKPKNPNGQRAKIAHVIRMGVNNETKMLDVVNTHGVVSSGFHIVKEEMSKLEHIGTGVWQSSKCTQSTNHAIVIVGFGTFKDPNSGQGIPYWLIRNSWGTEDLDHGYFKMLRGVNMCGIAKSGIAVTYDPNFCPKHQSMYYTPSK